MKSEPYPQTLPRHTVPEFPDALLRYCLANFHHGLRDAELDEVNLFVLPLMSARCSQKGLGFLRYRHTVSFVLGEA